MKFIVVRTLQQRNNLDNFFESFGVLRAANSRQWIIFWRPARFFGLLFSLAAFFYGGTVLAVTWWLQTLAPGFPAEYRDVADPGRWGQLQSRWLAHQIAIAPPDLTPPPSAAPLIPMELEADQSEPDPDAPAAPSQPSYGPLLTQFFTHNGGAEKLRNIRTILIHGSALTPEGATMEFSLAKKLPGSVRLSIHHEGGDDVTLATDGQQTWGWVGDPHVNGVRDASPAEAVALLRETLMCNVAVELLQNFSAVHEIPATPGQSEADHLLQLDLPDKTRATVSLAADTWRPERVQIDYDQAGIPSVYSILVHEWMTVDGVPEPARVEIFNNGSKALECHFTQIEYNPGLFDELFAPPSAATLPDSRAPKTDLPANPAAAPPADPAPLSGG